MRRIFVVAALGWIVQLSAAAQAADNCLLDLDFSKNLREVSNKGKGSFKGVLPERLVENYTGWCVAEVKSSAQREDSLDFVSFETSSAGQAQFCAQGLAFTEPGVYKVTVRARTPGAAAIRFVVRTGHPTYEGFLSGSFVSEAWNEKAFFFEYPADKPAAAFYLITTPGQADIERIRIERSSAEAFSCSMRRPSRSVRNYIRQSRFPLGLPCGWNLDRNCIDTQVGSVKADTDIPVLRFADKKPYSFYSSPFQTAYPGRKHRVRFYYRAERQFALALEDGKGKAIARRVFPAALKWSKGELDFVPPMLADAFALGFSSTGGELLLNRLAVYPEELGESPENVTEVALAPAQGEISDDTRIHFEDESPKFSWCVMDAPNGATLRISISDLYGRQRALDPIRLAGGRIEYGAAAYDVFPDKMLGQFRISACVEKDGRRVGAVAETVLTHVKRPRYWRRDAPKSSFGGHFNPNRSVIRSMKAAGINWVRLHDSGENTSAWAALEPQKGVWRFRDDEVEQYRRDNIKIFAQLGTAPKWATHYGVLGLKKFDYFERFLRPTNSVDWVNYVKTFVRRYDGVIDEYFVWNEPWARWWSTAADAKFYDPKKVEADFVELTRLAYRAVKSVNPSILVCGVNTHGGEHGRKWTAGCTAAGIFDFCDAVDWHYYSCKPRATRSDRNVTDLPFSPLSSAYPGLKGKPIYMTEGQGANDGGSRRNIRGSGLYRHTVPWEPDSLSDSAALADAICRFHISLLSEGNARLFIYTSHAYRSLAQRADFQLLVGADGFATPSLAAHAHLAQMIEDAAFKEKTNYGAKGLRYRFKRGGETIDIYSDLSEKEMRSLARRGGVSDLYGNPITEGKLFPGTLVYHIMGSKE